MGSVHFVSEIWKFGTQNFSLFSDAFEGRCTCFPGQGLLQGHSSKGLMAEAGGQPWGRGQQPDGAGLGFHGQHFHQSGFRVGNRLK